MMSDFELERIDYHFSIAKKGDRVQHDNSKYKPNHCCPVKTGQEFFEIVE